VATIYFDLLPKGWGLMGVIVSRHAPARFSGEISQSILFFIVFNLLSTIINLPFSYYRTFVLEEKFGFNKQTPRLVGRATSHSIG
jgi:STE24 endopeptidase